MTQDDPKKQGFSYEAVYEFLRFFGLALKLTSQTAEVRKRIAENLLQDLGSYITQHPEWSVHLKEEIRMLGKLQGKLLVSPEMPAPDLDRNASEH